MGSRLIVPAPAVHRGSSFAYSFSFLPKDQRDALGAVYAFCRETDDIVDNDGDRAEKLGRLDDWRRQFERSLGGGSDLPVLRRFAAAVDRYHIPAAHAYELLAGAEMDLTRDRYPSFDALKEYCYHVASSVGLMCLAIFSPKDPRTKEYAVHLGIALQLTNIIRDVGADARLGRIYLPLDEMARFGLAEADVLALRTTPGFASLMAFQTARARDYFRQAREELPTEDRGAMFAATIMERIYVHTLDRIERSRFDVLTRSIHLPRSEQFLIAVKYYLQRRLLGA